MAENGRLDDSNVTVTNRASQDWLQYCATQEQLDTFNNDGYLIVEEALTPQIIDQLTEVINPVDTRYVLIRALDCIANQDNIEKANYGVFQV